MYKIILISLFICVSACKKEPQDASDKSSQSKPAPKKILIVVTSNDKLKGGVTGHGYFLPEALDFYQVMLDSGLADKIVFASPKGGKAPMYNRTASLAVFQNQLNSTKILTKLDSTVSLSQINSTEYRAIYFVGGFACLFDFPGNIHIQKLAREIYESGGYVSAICHGPAALLNIKLSDSTYLIKDKKITSRTNAEDQMNSAYLPFLLETELEKRQCKFIRLAPGSLHMENESRIMTGQGPADAPYIARKLLEEMR